MIAVDPRNRFKRADEVLEAIDDVWTQQGPAGAEARKLSPAYRSPSTSCMS